jgi:hypothetical protein
MPIPLRADFNAGLVRAAAKRSKDGPQVGGFWRRRPFTMGRPAPRRRRLAA